MNNEQLFRQALQRPNDRAAKMKMPSDMQRRVMQQLARRRQHRYLWRYGAVAASVVLILGLFLGLNGKYKDVDNMTQQVCKTEQVTEIASDRTARITSPKGSDSQSERRALPVRKTRTVTKQMDKSQKKNEAPSETVCIDCELRTMEDEMLAMINELENM